MWYFCLVYNNIYYYITVILQEYFEACIRTVLKKNRNFHKASLTFLIGHSLFILFVWLSSRWLMGWRLLLIIYD